jgi:hypothetical protein
MVHVGFHHRRLHAHPSSRRALAHFRVRGWGAITPIIKGYWIASLELDGGQRKEVHMRRNWTRRRVLRATLMAGGSTLVAAEAENREVDEPDAAIGGAFHE